MLLNRVTWTTLAVALTAVAPAGASAALPAGSGVPDPTVPAARDTTPVILKGRDLGAWAAPANQTAKLPLADVTECQVRVEPDEAGDPTEGGAEGAVGAVKQGECPEGYDPHNHYAEPDADTKDAAGTGVAVDRLLGYRWHPKARKYVQIPFQVDEVFTRYLDNSASGFALYSGQDQHTTYAFDREGFRWDGEAAAGDPDVPDGVDPRCVARPTSAVAADPVAGLDHNDEVAFMATDAGPQAPAGAPLPRGVEAMKAVRITDPTDPSAQRWVYVARTGDKGPGPEYTADNGYVTYERDDNAGFYEKSESSYSNYGNAKRGVVCDAAGNVLLNEHGTPRIERRRPRDYATITTDRFRFRYDGRWLMSQVQIAEDDDREYGPDLVDRWKARAFQQDPGSETPCCGYEEEDTNWGGSSTLLGERVGPVRAIRETWGADSGTNVIRRETFYREEMRQKTWLRVHVIPPLDGIYAQWDFNAGHMTRFYNAKTGEQGVAVDGRNDEVYGNLDDPCNPNYDANTTSDVDQGYRSFYRQLGMCNAPYHQSVDVADFTFSDANAGMGWALTAGPKGSIVDRITVTDDTTAGGAAQSVAAVPYYRDDSCFDDGTGTNPGPKLKLRSADEPRTLADGTARKCWEPADGIPDDDPKYFQGSIATHGVHLLFVAESDNARQTVPVNEIVNEWQMVMLPGERTAIDGERYGRSLEKPLVATVLDG